MEFSPSSFKNPQALIFSTESEPCLQSRRMSDLLKKPSLKNTKDLPYMNFDKRTLILLFFQPFLRAFHIPESRTECCLSPRAYHSFFAIWRHQREFETMFETIILAPSPRVIVLATVCLLTDFGCGVLTEAASVRTLVSSTNKGHDVDLCHANLVMFCVLVPNPDFNLASS